MENLELAEVFGGLVTSNLEVKPRVMRKKRNSVGLDTREGRSSEVVSAGLFSADLCQVLL